MNRLELDSNKSTTAEFEKYCCVRFQIQDLGGPIFPRGLSGDPSYLSFRVRLKRLNLAEVGSKTVIGRIDLTVAVSKNGGQPVTIALGPYTGQWPMWEPWSVSPVYISAPSEIPIDYHAKYTYSILLKVRASDQTNKFYTGEWSLGPTHTNVELGLHSFFATSDGYNPAVYGLAPTIYGYDGFTRVALLNWEGPQGARAEYSRVGLSLNQGTLALPLSQFEVGHYLGSTLDPSWTVPPGQTARVGFKMVPGSGGPHRNQPSLALVEFPATASHPWGAIVPLRAEAALDLPHVYIYGEAGEPGPLASFYDGALADVTVLRDPPNHPSQKEFRIYNDSGGVFRLRVRVAWCTVPYHIVNLQPNPNCVRLRGDGVDSTLMLDQGASGTFAVEAASTNEAGFAFVVVCEETASGALGHFILLPVRVHTVAL